MPTRSAGFTLIELMIVVSIIAILVAVGVPAYQDYIARAQVAEAITMVQGGKVQIAEYAQTYGAFPTATSKPASDSLAVAGNYADAFVGDGNGIITVTFKGAGGVAKLLATTQIVFTPPGLGSLSDGTYRWDCHTGTNVPAHLLPKECR